MVACILDPRYKMQFALFYYHEIEKQEIDDIDNKIHNIRIKYVYNIISDITLNLFYLTFYQFRFEDLYLAYYFPLGYLPSDVSEIEQHVTNSGDASIVSSFESQLDDFFEYTKKAQTSHSNSL